MKGFTDNVLFWSSWPCSSWFCLNVVTGVAVALKTGVFQFKELGRFMLTKVAPYVLVWGALAVAGWLANHFAIEDKALTSVLVLVNTVYALVCGTILGAIG